MKKRRYINSCQTQRHTYISLYIFMQDLKTELCQTTGHRYESRHVNIKYASMSKRRYINSCQTQRHIFIWDIYLYETYIYMKHIFIWDIYLCGTYVGHRYEGHVNINYAPIYNIRIYIHAQRHRDKGTYINNKYKDFMALLRYLMREVERVKVEVGCIKKKLMGRVV